VFIEEKKKGTKQGYLTESLKKKKKKSIVKDSSGEGYKKELNSFSNRRYPRWGMGQKN